MKMVGNRFPDVSTPAVTETGEIVDHFNVHEQAEKQYAVVFFYPLDFTFVCPTEIVTFDKLVPEFEKRNVKIIAASVDSAHCHAAWRRTELNEGGIGEVSFPMIADIKRQLSTELGILTDCGVTYRASYLLDTNGVIRHMVVNDLPLGRNIQEMLRMVDALQFSEKHGDVCPANWKEGDTGISATREATAAYLSESAA